MKYELVVTDTGRRGAECTADGIGDFTLLKKRVTRHEAEAFDARILALTSKILDLSKKIGKAKGETRKKLSDELFDANAEFICARVDGITPEQLSVIDTGDIAEISSVANELFRETFDAKKNG